MRVKVRVEQSGWHLGRFWCDWVAQCECGERLSCGDWTTGMEFALGHLCFSHNREVPC